MASTFPPLLSPPQSPHRHRLKGGARRSPVRSAAARPPEDRDGTTGKKARLGVETVGGAGPSKGSVVVASCAVGLLTGIGVVVFNNTVHEIRDLFWDGIPSRGASWLRELPVGDIWQRVVLIPVFGGVTVGILNSISNLDETQLRKILSSDMAAAVRPVFKAITASVTLGTGNSLGPEGPSVEIGASIAKGVGRLLGTSQNKSLSLMAAGSAAGIAAGFNAAVAGCFFAVESVLWPSPPDTSSSLSNSTSMVILSAVIAAVISEVGLGSDPAFTVPEYDFRSPSELPLYLLLGVLCGLVSLALSRCTSYAEGAFDYMHKVSRITKSVFPAFGGLVVGILALAYPEVLYWGFENVDILLESRPFVKGLPAGILLQLVGVKIVATSLSRASGLVGGYYAPSLFIGAATGMAYGKFMASVFSESNIPLYLPIFEVASPQAYGLVGMAATLAGVCHVPLTSVLLLFELTHDYRIVLPLLGAVGLSSWITSSQDKKTNVSDNNVLKSTAHEFPQDRAYQNLSNESSTELFQPDSLTDEKNFEEKLTVSDAMHGRYVVLPVSSSLIQAVTNMLLEKQGYVIVVDNNNLFVGLLALQEVQEFCRVSAIKGEENQVNKLLVSEIFQWRGNKRQHVVTPSMSLFSARRIMDLHGVDKLPVISEEIESQKGGGYLIGLLDRECIGIACRAMATKALLNFDPKDS